MIVPNRRSFLAGLVSACAAPAIITSAGFRPAILLPRVHERWIAGYNIESDTFVVLADFASQEIARPAYCEVIPRHLVERLKRTMRPLVDQCTERALLPGFQHHGFDWRMAAMRVGEWHETNLEASLERALKFIEGRRLIGLPTGSSPTL